MQKKSIEKKLTGFLIFIITLYGFYLCFIGGYGSDEDTLPMIYVFETRLTEGRFVTSRFTSYPIPEIGIGFLAYYFGSFAANSVTYLFFLTGIIIFFFSLDKKIDFKKLNLYLLLCLSSPILFFENLEPMDYSWAFFFFSIGTYFFSKKIFELSILGFGFAIGCRINFTIFVLIFIFFYSFKENIDFKKKLLIFLNTFIVGGLFYLPIWFDSSFSLDWISAARPTDQGFFGLIARFSYKTIMTFGLIQLILIIFFITKLNAKKFFDLKLLLFLTISNFILFLYIPAEKSYLQPAIIFINLILIREFNKNLVLILILLNLISWVISYDFLKFEYKNDDICAPKHAISASLEFKFTKGALKNFFDTRKNIRCWVNIDSERGRRILDGKSTKIPQKNVE